MQIDTNGVEIGDTVRDTITGFEGKVIGITQWTTGCARANVQPRVSTADPSKIPEAYAVDVLTLEVTEEGPRHVATFDKELVGASKGGPPTVVTRR